MSKELDRLLELHDNRSQKFDYRKDFPEEEYQSLKSQIESKLAQADNPSMCPICQGRGFVSEGFYSTTTGQWSSTSTLTEKCRSCNGLGIIQNSNQELSQLREEIKNHECLELQCPLCDGDLIVDDCVEHCVYCNSSLKHKFVLEDKSLRPIVQALRELMPTENQIQFSEKTPNANLATILKIQSILASSDKNVSSEVKCKHEHTEICPNLVTGSTCRICKGCGEHIRGMKQ